MIAFVLSGGGNRGPIQVGALRALFQASIVPEMLVGTSAGALNSAFLASNPTLVGVERLAQIWLNTRRRDIYPEGYLSQALRFVLGRDSLQTGEAVRNYVQKNIPTGISKFGDLAIKLYLTTADLQTGRLYLFGDDPAASLLDAVLASSAAPLVWPPQVHNGHQFVDGGVVADVPLTIALDRGADTIYVLDLSFAGPYSVVHGVYPLAMRSIGVLERQQLIRDMERVRKQSDATIHHIYLGDIMPAIATTDFSHTAEMIGCGYDRAREYLENPTPNVLPQAVYAEDAGAPPGAVPYAVPW